MTEALFGASALLAKLDGQAITGPEALAQRVVGATVSTVTTLLELLRSQHVSDADGVEKSAIPDPRIETVEKTARSRRRLTDAAEAANRATRAKRSRAQAEERKLHAEAAKSEAEAVAIRKDAESRRVKAIAEATVLLLEAISTLRQRGGDTLFSAQNLESILASTPPLIPATPSKFNVFLSHNSKDKPAVRELKKLLAAERVTVWLDEDELRPGMPWQQLLESGIRASGSVAVLVGKDGHGPWEDEEMRAALALAVRDKRPVIPVLLPGASAEPELPMLLSNRTWVDLRPGFTKDGLAKLIWGITGKKP